MKILLYEHLSGGGLVKKDEAVPWLSEGYALLSTLAEDFKRLKHETYATLDYRIANYTPPIEARIATILKPANDFLEVFIFNLADVEAAIIAAPESKSILLKLTEAAEKKDILVFGPASEVIRLTSNKRETFKIALDLDLPVPKAKFIPFSSEIDEIAAMAQETGYPLIFKPLDGANCNGITLVRDESRISSAIKNLRQETELDSFMIYPYIKGIAASATLLANEEGVSTVGLSAQELSLSAEGGLRCESGYVPLRHSLEEKALEYAVQIAQEIKGLRGWVDVDFVLSERREPIFIEINARITKNYLGIRRAISGNPAELIFDAIINQKLPEEVPLLNTAFFARVPLKLTKMSIARVKGLAVLHGIVGPPFPFKGNPTAAIVVSEGEDLTEAKEKLSFRKRTLQEISD
ncbi:MAG: ATP-grasp domain-containing protein [Candidatus Hodarchaeota archaeon]